MASHKMWKRQDNFISEQMSGKVRIDERRNWANVKQKIYKNRNLSNLLQSVNCTHVMQCCTQAALAQIGTKREREMSAQISIHVSQ